MKRRWRGARWGREDVFRGGVSISGAEVLTNCQTSGIVRAYLWVILLVLQIQLRLVALSRGPNDPSPQRCWLCMFQRVILRVFSKNVKGGLQRVRSPGVQIVLPKTPENKILVKIFTDIGENLAKETSPIVVLQFPRKVATRKFTKNPRQFPRATKEKSFIARLWELEGTTNRIAHAILQNPQT